VFYSSQDHLGTGTCDFDYSVLAGAKNTDSWHARKGDFQHAFPLDVSMVSSSAIVVATDGERLTCGGFSLGETVHLGNYEFTTDYFDGLSLSPRRGNNLPCPRRCGTGASLAPVTTTSQIENVPAAQAMTTVNARDMSQLM
jgi:hypothetical protein